MIKTVIQNKLRLKNDEFKNSSFSTKTQAHATILEPNKYAAGSVTGAFHISIGCNCKNVHFGQS